MELEKELKKLALIFCAILICATILILGNRSSKQTIIKDEVTGTNLQEKITCLPSNEKTIKLYEENGISLEGLEKCEDYKINGHITSKDGVKKDKKIFNLILVRPIAWVLIKIGTIFNNYTIALLLIILIKSIYMTFTNYKTALNNKKLQAVNEDIKKISSRYNKDSDFWTEENPYNETLAKINYADELKKIYKDNGIKPAAGCLSSIIQIFIIIALLNILYSVPIIFESKFLGLSLGLSPKVLSNINPIMTNGIIISLGIVTFLSSIISTRKILDVTKPNIIMAVIVSVLILSAVNSLPIGISIYFLLSNILNIIGKIIIYYKLK